MTKTISAKWETRKLVDVAKVIPGFAFKSKDWCKDGTPVIKIKNIVGDLSVDTVDVDCVPSVLLTAKLHKFVLNDGDILVAMTGATAGKVGRLRCKRPHLLNQRVAKLAPFDIDSLFFWAVVSSEEYQRRFFKLADGAAQPNMSGGQIESVELLVPPLPTQRKIAGILSAYDDLIENNTRRIAILEEMAQKLYKEWFVNFRFPGHQNDKFVDSPLGKIPDGWKVVTVEEIASHSTKGISPAQYPEEEFAHFSIPNYDKGKLPELETGSTIQSNKFVVLTDCVMLSKLNPRIPRIWLPEPLGDYRPVASTEFLILSPVAPSTREFIYYQFQSDDFSGRFRICSSGTSTSHQRVKPTDFVKLKALLPPSSLIEAFTKHVSTIIRLVHNRRIHSHNLRNTRDLLLPKLISGQLDVEDLDIDTGELLVESST